MPPGEIIEPSWAAPANVRALVTTKRMGDMAREGRERLRSLVPSEPAWMKQVHGTSVVEIGGELVHPEADAAVTRRPENVCTVMVADCMPVFFCNAKGTAVGVAHAGWRGLCAGVLEAAVQKMRVPGEELLAWLGPAIGPRAYEVGDEVRLAFLARDAGASAAFAPARAGHWLLDLYAIARQRLAACGVRAVSGGGFCTYTEEERFFSYRRARTSARMAALIWLT